MLYTVAMILLVLWILGLVTSYTIGGFIHILLVITIVVVLLRVIQNRRIREGVPGAGSLTLARVMGAVSSGERANVAGLFALRRLLAGLPASCAEWPGPGRPDCSPG